MYQFGEVGGGTASTSKVVSVRRNANGFYRSFVKRLLDIALVVVVSPIVFTTIGVLALIVRRDGGPAFYGQQRVGRDGEIFTCWKLRTMVIDAESKLAAYLESNPEARAEWERTQKLKNDPRITAFGRFARKSSLDELPQLWNILVGEMSLVGPRPMMPSQQAMYSGTAYYDLAPGLTGFWQVSERNESTFASRVGFDNRYARELAFGTDVKILLRTVSVVLRGTGY
jgi:exopolysaccharide production protein ExoY